MLITPQNDFAVGNNRLRKNTVRCDFSFLKRDLTVLELHNFVEHYLQLQPEQVELMQWNGIQRCVYLRLCDLYTARRLVVVHSRRHTYPPGRNGSLITIKLVDVPTEVRLYDLSELVTDEQVQQTLEEYGVVFDIAHSHWGPGVRFAGTPSGQRLVRMVVRKTLPRYLRIGNDLSTVFLANQRREEHNLGVRLLHNLARGWRGMKRAVRTIMPAHHHES